MREAFSQGQKIILNQEKPPEQKENQKKQQKKTPIKKETLQKLTDLKIDSSKVLYEEDALALIEEKTKEEKEKTPKRNKQEQIRFEAATLAENLEIPLSEEVGTKAILDSIKEKIEAKKQAAGHDLSLMADALALETSYKAICTEYEVYNNTMNRLGVASLGDYNRYMLNFHVSNKINKPRS